MRAMLGGIMDAPRPRREEDRWAWQPRGDVLVVNGYLEGAMKLQKIPRSVYWGLALLAVAVVVLVGPVDYLVLGWFKKRAMSWVTAIGWLVLAGGVGAVLPGLIRTDATQVVSGRVVDLTVDRGGKVVGAASGQIAGVYSSEPQRMDVLKVLGVEGGYFHGAAAEADWFMRGEQEDQWTKPALVSLQTIGQEGLTTARSLPSAMRLPRWNLRCMMGEEVGVGEAEASAVADGFEKVRVTMGEARTDGKRVIEVRGWPGEFASVQGVVAAADEKQYPLEVSGGPGAEAGVVVMEFEPIVSASSRRVLMHDVWNGPLDWAKVEEMGLGKEIDRNNNDWQRTGAGELWQLERVRRRDMAFIRRSGAFVSELRAPKDARDQAGMMVILWGVRERKVAGAGADPDSGAGAKVIRETVVVRTMVQYKERTGD